MILIDKKVHNVFRTLCCAIFSHEFYDVISFWIGGSLQGRKFWIQFLAVYRMSATEYGVIKDLVNMKDSFQSLIDELFIFMHENFIDGRYIIVINFGLELLCGSFRRKRSM